MHNEAKNKIQNEFLTQVNLIAGKEVGLNESLLIEAIDSIALVELINLIDDFAKKNNKKIDLDSLISEDPLTVELILSKIN